MGSEWTELPLEEAMDAIIDYRGKTPKKTASGIPLITAKIVKNGRINPTQEYIAESDYDSWMKRGIPQKGDIVLTTEAPLGEVAQLNGEKIALAQRIITLRGKAGLLESDFLKYLLQSNEVQHQLTGRSSGTTVSGIKQSELRKIILCFPPLPEQKAIAHILGSLDDKIELNQRMNATLEGLAQALFQSWFVDFDPVLDNALAAGNPIPDELTDRAAVRRQALDNGTANREAAQHFPATFQFTEELGWIPEGWEAGCIGVIAKAIGGYAFKSKVFQERGYPVIKIKNIVGDGTVSIEDSQCIDSETAEKAIKFSLSDGDILMAMTGATVGKIGIVVNGKNVAFLNQRVAKLVGRSVKNINSFLFCFFKYQENFEQIVGAAGGSAQPNISSSGIESVQFPVPSKDLLIRFTNLVDPNFEKWISNYKLINSLSKLRDTLLPQLISGELRIPDAAKLAEAALA